MYVCMCVHVCVYVCMYVCLCVYVCMFPPQPHPLTLIGLQLAINKCSLLHPWAIIASACSVTLYLLSCSLQDQGQACVILAQITLYLSSCSLQDWGQTCSSVSRSTFIQLAFTYYCIYQVVVYRIRVIGLYILSLHLLLPGIAITHYLSLYLPSYSLQDHVLSTQEWCTSGLTDN